MVGVVEGKAHVIFGRGMTAVKFKGLCVYYNYHFGVL